MVEYRWQLIGSAFCLVALIWLIGWWFARSESSSVVQVLRAEAIVQRLKNPEASPGTAGISVEQDLKRLQDLAKNGTPLASRFSGVIAEEEVVQHVQPISEQRFSVASENLDYAHLPLDASLVQATLLFQAGKLDEALKAIDSILEKSVETFPEVHAYALLQKATILRKQNIPNSAVITELEAFLSTHNDVDSSFDHIFSGKIHTVLSFLKIN
jgi:hypothetical protein